MLKLRSTKGCWLESFSLKTIFSRLSNKTEKLLDRAKLTEHTFMIIVAIIIGILAGFAAIAIRFLIHEISHLSYSGDGSLLQNIIDSPWYLKILVPVIGGLIVGPLIYFFAPEAKGHGVRKLCRQYYYVAVKYDHELLQLKHLLQR